MNKNVNKGKRGEREFAYILNTLLGEFNLRRRSLNRPPLRFNAVADPHGNNADIISIDGLAIEVKRQETLTLGMWWDQACRQADRISAIPVVAYRKNRGKWNILLPGYLLGIGIRGYIQCDMDTFSDWLEIYLTE